jgi:hypothetical protein
MKDNLTKREFLELSAFAGVTAALWLLPGKKAEATKPQLVANLLGLAESLTAISYLAGFAFAVAAIIKFKQAKDPYGPSATQKDNPTQGSRTALAFITDVWVLLDSATATSLEELGYSPQFLVEAIELAKGGDASDLLAFFTDLETLAEESE